MNLSNFVYSGLTIAKRLHPCFFKSHLSLYSPKLFNYQMWIYWKWKEDLSHIFNSIHLVTKYITLFNIVKHSMKVFTSNNKLTSIFVNCSRNNSRSCFIHIIMLPLQLTHPINANMMLQDAMFIRKQFGHNYYTCMILSKTDCNLGPYGKQNLL